MSFRINATDHIIGEDFTGEGDIYHQVYGNNEFPEKLKTYLTNHGVKLDEDGCFLDYKVTDIQSLLEVMLEIHNEQVKDESYWQFKPTMHDVSNVSGLLGFIEYRLDCAIALTMYNFYKAFESFIDTYWDDQDHCAKYKLKEGANIYLSGF